MNRREFISGALASAGVMTAGASWGAKEGAIRAALLHFGTNMWQQGKKIDKLNFDYAVWKKLTGEMQKRKFTHIIIDLGECLVYPSHPKIGVEGSWTPEQMSAEVRRLKAMGLEPIPKLNFSTTHSAWMGPWRSLAGTERYRRFCRELIKDAYEIFEHPKCFHIGYDEEVPDEQTKRGYELCIIRQGELWWKDFLDVVDAVEGLGMQAWVFGGYQWEHPEFLERCPKSVIMNLSYYREEFDIPTATPVSRLHLRAFEKSLKAGFNLVPNVSNCRTGASIAGVVKFVREQLKDYRSQIKGYLTAPWEYSIPYGEKKCLEAIDLLADALEA